MSAEMLPVKDAIEEDLTVEVPIATSNPFRPTVYATENFLEELSKRLQNDVNMLPVGAVRRWKKEMQILLGSSKIGLIYMATSLAQMLDLQLKDTNIDGVVFDACVIVCDHPVQILTFVRSVSKDKYDTLIQRNDELSKGVLYSLREFTDEKFNILNGVLDIDELKDRAGFEDKRNTIFEKSGRYVNPRSLHMNPNKCRNLCKAFFVAAAVDHTSNPTSSDKIVLLKWDVYQLLEKYLDEPLVIVNYASKERVMKEVDRRLSRSGSTVVGVKPKRVATPHKTMLATPSDEDDTVHNVADSCASSQMAFNKGNLSADHLCRATETETCSKSEITTIRSSNPTGLQHSEASPFTDRFSTSVISVEEIPKEENIKRWLKDVTPLSDSGLGTDHDNDTSTVDSTLYDISRSGPDQDPYQSDADTDSGDSAQSPTFTGGYRLLREPRLDADRPVSGISFAGRESPWK